MEESLPHSGAFHFVTGNLTFLNEKKRWGKVLHPCTEYSVGKVDIFVSEPAGFQVDKVLLGHIW